MTTYKLSWEMVKQNDLHLFSNADPRYYSNTLQVIPNSDIPDEHWYELSREDSHPWQQYHQLKKWADEDIEFVRNVRIERLVGEPQWEPVPDDQIPPENP